MLPTGGASSTSQNPLAGFEGALCREGKRGEKEGTSKKGRQGTEGMGEKHPPNKFLVTSCVALTAALNIKLSSYTNHKML